MRLLAVFGALCVVSATLVAGAGAESPGVQQLNLVTVAGVVPGDGRPATKAQLRFPTELAWNAAGDLFIADSHGPAVRKVGSLTGTITSVAGQPLVFNNLLSDGSPAASAGVFPEGVAVDSVGNVFYSEQSDPGLYGIRRVDALSGLVSTIPATAGKRADGVAFDQGNLYFVEQNRTNGKVWMVTPGADGLVNGSPDETLARVAGGGAPGVNDGSPASGVRLTGFGEATNISFDAAHDLYVSERGSHFRVRKIVPGVDGKVDGAADDLITTVAGNGTSAYAGDGVAATATGLQPTSAVVAPSGDVYIGDWGNDAIRKVDHLTGLISTIAGTGVPGDGGDGGPATVATLRHPTGLAFGPDGKLYFADDFNGRIRRIDLSTGTITTVAGRPIGDGGPATSATLSDPRIINWDAAGNGYLADRLDYRVRKLLSNGTITTIAGFGVSTGFPSPAQLNEGGPALQAMMQNVEDAKPDRAGNVFIAESRLGEVRRIDATTGVVTTVASGLDFPNSLAFAPDGSLYIANGGTAAGGQVARLASAFPGGLITGAPGETLTTVVGSGNYDYTGDGGPASAADVTFVDWLAVDSTGNLFFTTDDPADGFNCCVREVLAGSDHLVTGAADETISTVAGTRNGSFVPPSGDGGPATAATIYPFGIAVGADGAIYVSDVVAQTVRRVDAATHVISVIAGNGTEGVSLDGPALSTPIAGLNNPFLDPAGNVYFSSVDRIRLLASAAQVKLDDGRSQEYDGQVTVTVTPQFDVHLLDQGSFTVQAIDPLSGEPTSARISPAKSKTKPGTNALLLKFRRSALESLQGPGGPLNLRVLGKTTAGLYVSGTVPTTQPPPEQDGHHGQHGHSEQHGHHDSSPATDS